MNNTSINFLSLNIEQDYHLKERLVPFLLSRKFDVIFLQDVLAKDLSYLASILGMQYCYAGLYKDEREHEIVEGGIATFYALPLVKSTHTYYRGDGKNLPIPYSGADLERAIIVTEVDFQNKTVHFVNTHFTWSPDGQANEQQRQDLQTVFELLKEIPECILAGDFNAPRGGEIFDALSARYQDNIPKNVISTIDNHLHKAGALNLVVDGLFSTPAYKVDSVEIINNLSDHCAIAAKISKWNHKFV